MTEKPVPRSTRERARALRANMPDAERRLWRALRAHRFRGVHFRRQAAIGPYIVDFAAHGARLVIEVDGGPHASSSRDQTRDAWLAGSGYRVLRFWNTDVLRDLSGVLDAIGAALPPPRPSPIKGEGDAIAPDAAVRPEPGRFGKDKAYRP